MRIANAFEARQAQYKALFEMIENKEHWKKPIHAVIPKNMFAEFSNAAAYFHGAHLEITNEIDGCYEVENEGYTCW